VKGRGSPFSLVFCKVAILLGDQSKPHIGFLLLSFAVLLQREKVIK
jgi:hypothetical protein